MAIVQTTVDIYPSSYDADYAAYNIPNITRAYHPATNTSEYGQVNLTRGDNAVTYFYFKFDTSAIPANATILAVSCQIRLRISTTTASYVAIRQVQMFAGTTPKGDPSAAPGSNTTLSLAPGTWTREEMNDARIRLYAVRGSSNVNNSYGFVIYGATLTVDYEYDDTPVVTMPMRVKVNGAWETPTKVLVKQSGIWQASSGILAKDNGTWK